MRNSVTSWYIQEWDVAVAIVVAVAATKEQQRNETERNDLAQKKIT